MLVPIKMSQFGGINTVEDSANEGITEARYCRNFIPRPLGALGLAASYKAFAPGGSALSVGFITNIDYLFDGARLLLQSPQGDWWDATPGNDGLPNNVTVTAPGSTLSANLVLTSSQIMGFKLSATVMMQISADQFALGAFYQRINSAPYYTTRYTADRAFTTGFGPVFTDGAGNTWLLYADTTQNGVNARSL